MGCLVQVLKLNTQHYYLLVQVTTTLPTTMLSKNTHHSVEAKLFAMLLTIGLFAMIICSVLVPSTDVSLTSNGKRNHRGLLTATDAEKFQRDLEDLLKYNETRALQYKQHSESS